MREWDRLFEWDRFNDLLIGSHFKTPDKNSKSIYAVAIPKTSKGAAKMKTKTINALMLCTVIGLTGTLTTQAADPSDSQRAGTLPGRNCRV